MSASEDDRPTFAGVTGPGTSRADDLTLRNVGLPGFTLREAGEAILQLYTDWGNAEKRAAWAARLEK